MVTCTGHIGIHEGADGCTYVVRTAVHDVMAIKPNFLTSMGYHIFLTMVLRARGAPLETVVLRRWEIETEIYFIKQVNKGQIATVKSFTVAI